MIRVMPLANDEWSAGDDFTVNINSQALRALRVRLGTCPCGVGWIRRAVAVKRSQ
jgi:hypothetical protein